MLYRCATLTIVFVEYLNPRTRLLDSRCDINPDTENQIIRIWVYFIVAVIHHPR